MITHHHGDHIGSLADVVERMGAQVLAHALDAPVLRGERSAPGHTRGSIAIYLPKRRLLFSGDAAVSALGLGPPSGPFGLFNEDRTAARASFRRLAELEFDVACFGHGKPLDRDGSLAFRKAAERLG